MRINIPNSLKCVILFALGCALLASCSSSEKRMGLSSNIQLDTKNLVEKELASAAGGSIALKADDGASIKIVFPQGSLEKDSMLVAAPLANQPLKDSSMKGFSLEEKATGKGPSMKSPAFVVISVDKELPKDTSIVRLVGDGYEAIPTVMKYEKGKTILSGTVNHFSAYTTKQITPQEEQKAKLDEKDFDWVIYVNDTYAFTNGPMQNSVTLNLKARNISGGGIMGTYYGSATAKSTNYMAGAKGSIDAPFASKSSNLKLEVGPYLAELTPPPEDPNLAPLTTEDPDFSGFGSISMSTSGTGIVESRGYRMAAGASNKSTVPIEVNIIGPQVRLIAKLPQATLYFNGYIRGEGKASGPEPLAPLVPAGK